MNHTLPQITIVGAGLAGCEAALQLAARGYSVRLIEQKPKRRTPAQVSDHLCELVCSNSFRGAALSNAVGLLKEEMRLFGSFTMQVADATRVPAGGALAVDRERFSGGMSELVRQHPGIELVVDEVMAVPAERPLLLATGPLTGDALAEDLAMQLGLGSLAYYDAISPIISADSIDWEHAFMASRWDKGESEEEKKAYVNCPLSEEGYNNFVDALLAAEKVKPREFEDVKYFEGCLPIEVMAERGRQTLAFGPMKPVGLTDPKTQRWPHAVLQLRKEDDAGSAYNMVGFQTRMTFGEQKRVFGLLPALKNAEYFRHGSVHRNTFIHAPTLLNGSLRLPRLPGVYMAGQITGVEGYVESAASGCLAAFMIHQRYAQSERSDTAAEPLHEDMPRLPATTAHGGLMAQLRRGERGYQPSNITFAHIEAWEGPRLKKRAKYEAMAQRALQDLKAWPPLTSWLSARAVGTNVPPQP